MLRDQETHFLGEIKQLQLQIDQQARQFHDEKTQWDSVQVGLEQEIGQLRQQDSTQLQGNLRTVWLQEQELEWRNKEIAIEQHWQSVLREQETAWASHQEAEWKNREIALEQHWQTVLKDREVQWLQQQ